MIDLFVVAGYIAFIFILAFRNKSNSAGSDKSRVNLSKFYLAGNSLTLKDSIFSIIATEVSALTFIGIPAFAYGKNFSFIYIYLGASIGRLIISGYILPKIYGQGITLYEIIIGYRKSSRGAHIALSLFYILGRVLGVGVRLYAGSILVAQFFEVSIYTAIGLSALITYIYTLIGGLKVVVKTDFYQVLIFVLGGFFAHYLIADLSNFTWMELLGQAYSNGKIVDFSNLYRDLFIGVVGGILFDICTHGMDQDFVQRLLACKDLKTAQKSIMLSSIFSISIGLLFLSIGALLWSHYQAVGLPADIKIDKIFAYFITTEFPVGLRGLMLAGVLAATMSTLDSTINAVGSCLSVDIWNRDSMADHKVIIKDTTITILLLLIVAIGASQSSEILEFGLKIASWIGGGILVIFLTQVLKTFEFNLSLKVVLTLILVNILFVTLNVFVIEGPWQFNVYYSVIGGLLFSYFSNKIFTLDKTA